MPSPAELALELVNISSVSRHEQEITDWIANFVTQQAPHMRIHHRHPQGIIFGSEEPFDVVLAGHSDTVPVQDNYPGYREGEFIYGLGASDMKGGVAVMLSLASKLRKSELNPLFVVFGCEEVNIDESIMAKLFVAYPKICQARLAVVMEPTDNWLEVGAMGTISAELTLTGVAAHSARPWLGVNAIHKAIKALAEVASSEPIEVELGSFTFREVISVTKIEGGVATNVVPDRVLCTLNYRYAGHRTPAEAETELRRMTGGEGELRILSHSPAAPVAIDNPLLTRLHERGNLKMRPKQAWTPAAEFAAQGVDAVNFGPGDPGLAHKKDERISIAAMDSSLATLRKFLEP